MEDRTGGVGAPGKGESPLPKAAEQAASHDVDDFPDPDEDDLDDLDGVFAPRHARQARRALLMHTARYAG